jgi:hypothetical protein
LPEPTPTPTPTRAPLPLHTPTGIVAFTESGDVVLIDTQTLGMSTIASFPPVHASGDVPVSSFLTDTAAVPGGSILLSTCCEPAAGYIRVLNRQGMQGRALYGDDPEVDPSGRHIAMASLQSLAIGSADPRARAPFDDIPGRGLFGPVDPGWSPDGDRVVFSLRRRLGLVDVSAASLREARYLLPSRGMFWDSTTYLRSGPLAVEMHGKARSFDEDGPSRIVRVDFRTGERRILRSTDAAITDLATDRAATSLLWVEGGTLYWRVDGIVGSLPGTFLKAAFLPP